jgi:hypothetical protein
MRINAEELHQLLRLDLLSAGWLDQGSFPGQSHRQVAMDSLHNSFLKKFHNEEVDEVRNSKALALFSECNIRCQNFEAVIPRRLNEELVINECRNIIYDFFNPHFRDYCSCNSLQSREPLLLNLSDISLHFGLGSGSNIGSSSTDFYTKFANSLMSTTNPVLPILFRQAISRDKLWADIEAYRHKCFGSEIVTSSRLSFVPKSRDISRTICTEPLLNMLFQKGIAGVLEGRLREVFNINLSNQPNKNAQLARIGSVSGKFGTIDLSSASDSISITMLKHMLPKEPLDWLLRCRSPSTVFPNGDVVDLHLISSMGNGYTFPLQTMIFAALVVAAYRVYDIPVELPRGRSLGNFAVFGDDIIVDSRVYNVVVDCLEVLGFSVNRNKSFNEGFFRESCGSDFYSGHNVRGVYLKKLLTAGDFYSAINRLNRWSGVHGILLSRTVGALRSGCRFLGVPFDEADDAGIKIPLHLLRTPRRDINGAIVYMALVNLPRRVFVPSVEFGNSPDASLLVDTRKNLPSFDYNSDALLFCLLAGWLRDGYLGLRSLSPKAVLRKRVCPGWDNRAFARGESLESYSKWEFAVTANLVS